MRFSSRVSPLLLEISAWFIPEQTGDDAASLTRRGRLLLVVLFLCAVNLLMTTAVQSYLGNAAFAKAAASPVLLALAIGLAMRLGAPIRWLTNITVATIYLVTLAITLGSDGRWAGGLFFLVLVPAISILLVDRRSGIAWSIVTIASIFAVEWFSPPGAADVLIPMSQAEAYGATLRSAAMVTIAVSAVAYFYSTLSDQAQRALSESVAKFQSGERRFRAITENANDLIAELDIEGRITFASPGFEEALGWRPDQLVGATARDGLDPQDLPRLRESWTQLMEKGAVRQEPLRIQDSSGHSRWFEVSMRVYTMIGEQPRVVAVARDVTDRLEREKTIRHQQNLVALGTAATRATHQLNGPIGSILSSAQFANQFRSNPDFGALAGESLDTIEEEAKRCGRIMRSMLDFAREESTERWIEDIQLVARRAACAVELEGWADAEIVLSFCPGKPRATVSPIEIEQALIDLLRGALQAGSTVVVLGVNVIANDWIEISISDDGPRHREDPATLAGPTATTGPGAPSDIGLSFARKVAESHGGRLELRESSAEGAIFKLTLPRA